MHEHQTLWCPSTLVQLPFVEEQDRKSTRLNSSHDQISYAVFCLKKKIYTLSLHDALPIRSEEHTSELQSRSDLVCRLLLEKKKKNDSETVIQSSMHSRMLVITV